MAAPKGNEYNKCLPRDDKELRKDAYKQFCDHIALGKPIRAWRWIHPTDPLKSMTSVTMEKYIKEEPEDFAAIYKEIAIAANYEHWFCVVSDSAKGLNEKANTASLQMIMRNIHGWDKQKDKDDASDEERKSKLDKALELIKDLTE